MSTGFSLSNAPAGSYPSHLPEIRTPPPPNHTNYTAIVTAARVSICTVPAVGAFPDHFTSLPDTVRKAIGIGPLRDQDLSGFLVVEGKLNLITMDISQALTEMYACAKRLGYGVVQVTNDHC